MSFVEILWNPQGFFIYGFYATIQRHMAESVAKNTVRMTLASVAQKIVSFVYFTLVARALGAEGTGMYVLAITFTTIFVVFVDLGFVHVLVRECAKAPERIQHYLSNVLGAKLVLGFLAYTAMVVAAHVLGYRADVRLLMYVSGITMLFDSLHLSLYGVLRVYGNLFYESVGMVGSQLLTLAFGSIFLWFSFPIVYLILAFTIPSIFNALYAGGILWAKHGIRLIPAYDRQTLKFLSAIGLPFALAAIFARVYTYVDAILLSKFIDEVAVGWYSIAFKISTAFQFVPMALVAPLYPRLSEYYAHNKAQLERVFHHAIKYMFLVATPISLGIFILAPHIVLLLYTDEYLPAVVPLQILMISLIFVFINFLGGAFLNAANRQKTQTTILGITMLINIVTNLLVIPRLGVVGAALAALVTNVLMTLMTFVVIPRVIQLRTTFLLRNFFFILLSGATMAACVYGVVVHAHLWAAVGVGILVYLLALFATRSITRDQLREAIALVKK